MTTVHASLATHLEKFFATEPELQNAPRRKRDASPLLSSSSWMASRCTREEIRGCARNTWFRLLPSFNLSWTANWHTVKSQRNDS